MKNFTRRSAVKWWLSLLLPMFIISACQKQMNQRQQPPEISQTVSNSNATTPPFNLEVILRGEGGGFGLIKFRQNVDIAKIISLDTWVRDLEPNHQYLLQRAVDVIIDGNCTGSDWLTLGKGLTPQPLFTDANGTAREELWRDVSAIASGAEFDIHFRIIDANSMAVVLASDCYQYVVR
jgi:hypothetical protein